MRPNFDGKNRVHLNDCQPGNQDTVAGISHQFLDAMGACFLMVDFGQRAGVEKVCRQSEPALAAGDNRLRPRVRVFGRGGPDFINAGDAVHRINFFLNAFNEPEIEVGAEWILG